jgi:ABC-type amino acid transport substrate-binding protein
MSSAAAVAAALAAPSPETLSAAAGVSAFSIRAAVDPGVMPRVLELFAKRGMVPRRWVSAVVGDELTIDVEVQGFPPDVAEYVANCLRQVTFVEVVLMSTRA